uniref:Uncharacterized protein n=2 Tax=Caenorhabditis japonica TaxID=281687 RepID=A0A8R1IT46_CAEJA
MFLYVIIVGILFFMHSLLLVEFHSIVEVVHYLWIFVLYRVLLFEFFEFSVVFMERLDEIFSDFALVRATAAFAASFVLPATLPCPVGMQERKLQRPVDFAKSTY